MTEPRDVTTVAALLRGLCSLDVQTDEAGRAERARDIAGLVRELVDGVLAVLAAARVTDPLLAYEDALTASVIAPDPEDDAVTLELRENLLAECRRRQATGRPVLGNSIHLAAELAYRAAETWSRHGERMRELLTTPSTPIAEADQYAERTVPAEDLEPGWLVRARGEWLRVNAVLPTDAGTVVTVEGWAGPETFSVPLGREAITRRPHPRGSYAASRERELDRADELARLGEQWPTEDTPEPSEGSDPRD